MSFFGKAFAELSLAEAQRLHNLTLFPLIASVARSPDYVTLDDAIASGAAEVSELSEDGSVPELRFLNKGDRPILLVDGEELVGAKQNRILNLSILAPAGQSIVIPVSCVEHGRWSAKSRHFKTSNRMHFSSARARKTSQVSMSMREDGARRSNQSDVWSAITEKQEQMFSRSETSAMSDIYEDHSERLNAFVEQINPLPNQVGAVFALGSDLVSVEVFDSPVTFTKLLPKLLRSYGLDAIEPNANDKAPPSLEQVSAWLAGTGQIEPTRFKAIGLGDDIRMDGVGYAGAALVTAGEHAVHLCAFTH